MHKTTALRRCIGMHRTTGGRRYAGTYKQTIQESGFRRWEGATR
jgi:hypothetical protein